MDRSRLAREKQLKEEAMRENEELERKLAALQDEMRAAQEALVSNVFLLILYFFIQCSLNVLTCKKKIIRPKS